MKRRKIELGFIDDVDIRGLVLLVPWTIPLSDGRRVLGWWRFFVIV